MPPVNCLSVLFAEDEESDRNLTQTAVRRGAIPMDVTFVADGLEAVAYLENAAARPESHIPPELLVVDLRMPKMGGLAVLKWVRSNPHYWCLQTLVLTASLNPKDKLECMKCGADGFLDKPMNANGLTTMLRIFYDNAMAKRLELEALRAGC